MHDIQYYTAEHLSHLMTATVLAILGSICGYWGRNKGLTTLWSARYKEPQYTSTSTSQAPLLSKEQHSPFDLLWIPSCCAETAPLFVDVLLIWIEGEENCRVGRQHRKTYTHPSLQKTCQPKGPQTGAPNSGCFLFVVCFGFFFCGVCCLLHCFFKKIFL